jgi:putative ABC transport system substrate-binding protein
LLILGAWLTTVAPCAGAFAAERGEITPRPLVALLNPAPPVPHFREIIRASFSEAGYESGRNFSYLERWSEGREELLHRNAAELAKLKVDVLYVGTSAGVRAALDVTRTIPIVAIDMESDPIANGWAVTLAKPGGNVTGFFLDLPELSGKRFEQLRELIPRLSRVAVLWDDALDPTPLKATEVAARSLGLSLVILKARRPEELQDLLDTAAKNRVQAVFMLPSPMLEASGQHIAALALQRRLPIAGAFPTLADAGFLLTYGPDINDLVRRSIAYIDRILKGEKAANLPIQRPAKFDLVLNTRTAVALGVKFPESLLSRADRIVR